MKLHRRQSPAQENSRTQCRRRSTRQRRREKPGVLYSTNATPTLSSERRRETTPHAATGPEGNLTTRTDDSKTKNREPKARSNCQHRRTAPQKTPQDLNAAAASPAVTKEEKVQRSHQPTKAATQTKQPWPFSKKKQPQHTKAPIRTQKEGNKPHAPRSRKCISVTGDDRHAEPEEPKA